MGSIELSERLMRRGWWSEAEEALRRRDVAPADRLLQGSALVLRREAVEWLKANRDMSIDEMKLRMLRRFDVYTINWVLNEYAGEGALVWRTGNEKAKDRMD